MSRSYHLCCLFCKEHDAYTEKKRWKNKTNNPHLPKFWKKVKAKEARQDSRKCMNDRALGLEDSEPEKQKKNIFYYLW